MFSKIEEIKAEIKKHNEEQVNRKSSIRLHANVIFLTLKNLWLERELKEIEDKLQMFIVSRLAKTLNPLLPSASAVTFDGN